MKVVVPNFPFHLWRKIGSPSPQEFCLWSVARGVRYVQRFADFYADVLQDYKNNDRRSLYDLEKRWELHLEPFFGAMRATQVGEALISKYVAQRQTEEAGNATINRELAVLRRCFKLAIRGKDKKIPPRAFRLSLGSPNLTPEGAFWMTNS